jgi:lysozyme
MNAFETLKIDEGLRLKAYQDHLGIWTIGYGTNLQVLEISEELAEQWLEDKWEYCKAAAAQIPGYDALNADRKDVIHSMIYQMGFNGVKRFKDMWAAIVLFDFEAAAEAMSDSRWYRDPKTQDRANRMAVRMAEGRW